MTKVKTYQKRNGTIVRQHKRRNKYNHVLRLGILEIYWNWGKQGYVDSWMVVF